MFFTSSPTLLKIRFKQALSKLFSLHGKIFYSLQGGIHFGRTELSAFFDVEEMATNERVTGEGRHFLGKRVIIVIFE
jgi:hypothetical protein